MSGSRREAVLDRRRAPSRIQPVRMLSARERQLTARMTNKEITDEIYLSHRTVGAHLYQAFPKLRSTDRRQLRDALSEPRQQRSTE